jgi:hypothetical protein
LDQGNRIKWISSTLSRNIDKTTSPKFPNKLTKEPYHIYRHKRKKTDRATVELATAKAKLLHDDYTKRRKRKNTKNK